MLFGPPVDRMMPEPSVDLERCRQRALRALTEARLVAAVAQALASSPACRVDVELHCKDEDVRQQSYKTSFTPTRVRSRGGRGVEARSLAPLSRAPQKSGEKPTWGPTHTSVDSD